MKHPEDNLQIQAADYFNLMGYVWYHVANERKTSPQAGARLKRKGVKAGVPDCCLCEPTGRYHGIYIELKIKPNKPTASQLEWLAKLKAKGYLTAVAFSIDEVIEICEVIK